MKKITLICFLICSALQIKSQVAITEIAPEDIAFNSVFGKHKIPEVTGRLLGFTKDDLKNLEITYTLVTPFAAMQVEKTTKPAPDGRFNLEIDYPFPYQQIWFHLGDYFYAGLYANKDLYLEFDIKKLKASGNEVDFNGEGVRYLGTDGPLNKYLNNFVLYQRSEQLRLSAELASFYSLPAANSDSLLQKYKAVYDTIKSIEGSYADANPSPYGWILENERLSDYYGQICVSFWGKKMNDSLWQKISRHKSYLISNSGSGFYNGLTSYLRDLPGFWVSTTWAEAARLGYLNVHEKLLVDSLTNSEELKPAYPYTDDNIKKWSESLRPQMQKIALLRLLDKTMLKMDSVFGPSKADFLKIRLNASKDLSDQKLELEAILPKVSTPWCKEVLKREYARATIKVDEINEVLARSSPKNLNGRLGRPVLATTFGASMYKAPGSRAIDLITKLKQTFPGKALIIDRWATWCAPCLDEMAHSKKLAEESKDLPVIFVYLCTINGSSEAKWKSKVVELKQPGIHFLIDEKQDADISGYFSFSGYPGYAYINKKGKYQPGAFVRPSEIEDRKALQALIDK